MNYSVQLSSGHNIPLIGLGTWQSKPEEVESAVLEALEVGYRHIDTAFNYNNEEAIGRALRRWFDEGKGTRDQLFIVTKLPHIGNRASDVAKYLTTSLGRLQLDYVDMYLVHLPFGFMPNDTGETPATDTEGNFVLDCDTDHVAVWKALETQVDSGKVRAIGLSNFNCEQMERVIKNARIKPSNVQVELHAYHQQPQIRQYCADHDIAITAYSPLGSPGAKDHFVKKYNYSPESFPDLLNHTQVVKIAEKYSKTPGQILLRHLVQQGIIVIPKSINAERIKQNFQIFDFELDTTSMQELNELDRGNDEGRILDFLFFKGVEKHPEYPFKQLENYQLKECV